MKKKIVHGCVYGLIALFYFWLMSCVPYTQDDWDWGISNGIQQLLTASINSRYVGNFFVVVMTRSQLLKTLIMGSCCFLIPLGIAAIVAERADIDRKFRYFLVSNVLMLLIGWETWRESLGWVSGFANYVISTVFLLAHLRMLLEVFEDSVSRTGDGWGKALTLGCTVFLGQLFLENLAICMVVLTMLACGVCLYRHRRLSKWVIAMAAGALLGLVVMFSSSIYGTLWSTGTAVSGVRELAVRSGVPLMENVKNLLLQLAGLVRRGGEKQLVINCIALGLLAFALIRSGNLRRAFKPVLVAANAAVAVYFLLVELLGITYTDAGMAVMLLGAGANFLYFLLVTVELVIIFRHDRRQLCRGGMVWISVIFYLAPLAVASTYGPRLYYVTNMLTILLICLLLRHLEQGAGEKGKRSMLAVAAAGLVCLMVYYGTVYHQIDVHNRLRLERIDQGVSRNAEEIVLPRYPDEHYLWEPDPENEERVAFFKAFYRIPESTVLRFE